MIDKNRKWIALGLALLMCCLIPVKALCSLAFSGDYYNLYTLIIPVITGLMVYMDRKCIFNSCAYSPRLGGMLALLGILLFWSVGHLPLLDKKAYGLSLLTFSAIVTGAGCFLACFGARASRRAAFPLGFLILTAPVPAAAMNQIVLGLQNGSAAFSSILFRLLHVPALREGMRFALPGLEIEIREQCSGTRSTLGLCIASILAGRFFIRTWWKQLILVLLAIPLVIFKNAVRIVTISILGIYVSRRFLNGPIHNYGGMIFSLLDLVLLAPIIAGLNRSDTPQSRAHRRHDFPKPGMSPSRAACTVGQPTVR